MTKHLILAREGWPHIAIVTGAALLVHFIIGWIWALPLWLVTLFVVQFFRDPPRTVSNLPGAIVAPADGQVIAVGEAFDPYLKRQAKRVRSPVAGKIMQRWYSAGAFFNAALDKASEHNERNALWVRTDGGADVVFVQVAGLIARRILCYVDAGERLERGQRYGFIRFGSRVDLYLPLESRIDMALGDKTCAATDVIATLSGD